MRTRAYPPHPNAAGEHVSILLIGVGLGAWVGWWACLAIGVAYLYLNVKPARWWP